MENPEDDALKEYAARATIDCPRCEGSGEAASERELFPCPNCFGTGKLTPERAAELKRSEEFLRRHLTMTPALGWKPIDNVARTGARMLLSGPQSWGHHKRWVDFGKNTTIGFMDDVGRLYPSQPDLYMTIEEIMPSNRDHSLPDEVECGRCNGDGFEPSTHSRAQCSLCWGTGKAPAPLSASLGQVHFVKDDAKYQIELLRAACRMAQTALDHEVPGGCKGVKGSDLCPVCMALTDIQKALAC